MGDGRTQVPEREFLAEVAMHPDPVVSAGELDDRLDVSRQAINSRLNRFEADGWVESKKVGSAARVWWLTPEGRDYLDSLRFSDSQ